MIRKLPRSFYSRPTLKVARELLGKLIVRRIGSRRLVGRIVEVEAYLGENDPASHAFRGQTPRNEVMFGRPGHLYVYFTYGMHFCANIVTEREGRPRAVLIRGVEPIEGIEVMEKNRGLRRVKTHKERSNLTNGPARFCEAFGIRRKENGTDLLGNNIFLAIGGRRGNIRIGRSPRIGIRTAMDKKWRFYIKGNFWVSKRLRSSTFHSPSIPF